MVPRSITCPAPPQFLRISLLWLGLLGPAQAQIKLDGSLGGPALNLAGPSFQIRADYGRQVGRNLFHSFQQFNLVTGEAAVFSGPAEVRNVLARVTGGAASSIDGMIQSTIPGADWSGVRNLSAAYTVPITPHDTTLKLSYGRHDFAII